MRARLTLAVAAFFAASAGAPAVAAPDLIPVSFSVLPGWVQQDHAAALQAFRASCQKPLREGGALKGRLSTQRWQARCEQAAQEHREDARAFFEQGFRAYRAVMPGENGLITGYYVPLLRGSLTRGGAYQYPLYAVPEDFRQPYLSRAQIEAGALKDRGLELVWLDDPVMRFFLHIQGSGRIALTDGRILTAQFAAKNGLPYTAIGKVLLEEGALKPGEVSLQTIRDYLRANKQRQREIFNRNASYIFFRLEDSAAMPRGGQGVALSPGHSLAVDTAYWPYGLPVYLDVKGEEPFQRLLIAQDTGSAIKGALRGDVFFGQGDAAEARAGRLAAPSDWYVLLPR